MFEPFLEYLDRVQPKPTLTDLAMTYLTNDLALLVDAVASRVLDRAER